MNNQSDTHNADGSPLTPLQRLSRGFTAEGGDPFHQEQAQIRPEDASKTPHQRLAETFTVQAPSAAAASQEQGPGDAELTPRQRLSKGFFHPKLTYEH
jgi:hypothetical protein